MTARQAHAPAPLEQERLAEALAAFDQGARILERAYRELWAARENERGAGALAVSEHIRDLCHELRNPLGGVRGLSSLLRRELETGEASDRARRLLARMDEGLEAIESILRGTSHAEQDRADAGAIAEETAGLALAENRAEGGDVRFRVDAPEGIELPLPAARFRELLQNLVRNAAQACRREGTVSLSVESTLEDLTVRVEDDGEGLPPVPDEVLFRRGFSTKGSGRGRGLALVRELVEQAGGTITFGRLGRGTRVHVRLPRR